LISKLKEILKRKSQSYTEEIKELSDQGIEGVALYKNLDLISVTVLIYSLSKVITRLSSSQYQQITEQLNLAQENLTRNNLGRYNQNLKTVYTLVRKSDAKVKEHLQDIMHAARIKNSASLLQKGLSIGQAAGLMGLSNWDLQEYAGKNTFTLTQDYEKIPAKKRMTTALKIFGVKI